MKVYETVYGEAEVNGKKQTVQFKRYIYGLPDPPHEIAKSILTRKVGEGESRWLETQFIHEPGKELEIEVYKTFKDVYGKIHMRKVYPYVEGYRVWTRLSDGATEKLHCFVQNMVVRAVIYEYNRKVEFRRRKDLTNDYLVRLYQRMVCRLERIPRYGSQIRLPKEPIEVLPLKELAKTSTGNIWGD